MPSPERQQPTSSTASTHQELVAALADIDQRLEVVNAHENVIERSLKREQLIEARDQIKVEIEEAPSSPE